MYLYQHYIVSLCRVDTETGTNRDPDTDKNANVDKTIVDRSTRAIGLRSQLKSLLSSISLGSFYFEISLIYRESMYLNSILVNCEAWYYI